MAKKRKWVKHLGRQREIEQPGSWSPKHIWIMWQRKSEVASGLEKNFRRGAARAEKQAKAWEKMYASFYNKKRK